MTKIALHGETKLTLKSSVEWRLGGGGAVYYNSFSLLCRKYLFSSGEMKPENKSKRHNSRFLQYKKKCNERIIGRPTFNITIMS